MVTITIDGREFEAPENSMLVDGAKFGDVEIPVFCYEPKLGAPVGACRMCLVEIEGIPKLQTACSTPVKDGMVVHTQNERVQVAQNAVLEFLLINHPLDCPVCDKGGECPLQDITFGWGPGTTRFIEPKRHFRKPLELSPLVAIDRERCILCYRCVRFSQEISEDYQLILQERGTHAYVSTFDGTPYVAPFTGNITELCPVGALTSNSYRFRARPWDIEGSGTVCALCPSHCNVELTVRDDRVMRVMARDHEEVDDGWLCDKGRYAYQYTHADERITTPLVRQGTELLPASWETAYTAAATALKKAKGKIGALAGGETSNEEAFLLQKLLREGLDSHDLSSEPYGELPVELATGLADPRLQAATPDLAYAHTVLLLDCDPVDEISSWDLWIRKGVRRNKVKLAVASARPTALDSNAAYVARFAPSALEGFLVGLDAAIAGDEGNLAGAAVAAGTQVGLVRDIAKQLTTGGEDVVIVASERRITAGVARALLNIATRLELAGRGGAGLLLVPSSANGRGVREAGFTPLFGPGYTELEEPGRGAAEIAAALASGELSVAYLLHADPLSRFPDRDAWTAALGTAQTVIAHEAVMTETLREYADVVFPAEAYPEKEGTLVHPDGRLQRLRPAIGRAPGAGRDRNVRAGWQTIAEISGRAGFEQRILAGGMASKLLFEAVPFYAGMTLDKIGGKGVRWPENVETDRPAWEPVKLPVPPTVPSGLRLGTFRTLWAAKEVGLSPALQFALPQAVVELSEADAKRLGVAHGEEVEVVQNGHRLRGPAVIRSAVPSGSVFVPEGIDAQPANQLTAAVVQVRGLSQQVPVPAAIGATAELAEQGGGAKPMEQEREDAGGVGGDPPMDAQDSEDL
jgi:NADH-quinone oxidoreductase subunit G